MCQKSSETFEKRACGDILFLFHLNLQGATPLTIIPAALENAVSAVIHSLNKGADRHISLVVSRPNLGENCSYILVFCYLFPFSVFGVAVVCFFFYSLSCYLFTAVSNQLYSSSLTIENG